MYSNVITAVFGASHTARTKSLHQWDYGQVLKFAGVNLPDAYTVHFSNQGVGGEAKTMVGNADGVTIPDEYLTTGQAVYAWVYLHTGADDGETVYSVIIPVVARPQPTEDAPTPVQQGAIDQAIAALNAGVQDAQEAAEGAATSAAAAQESAEAIQDMNVESETLQPGSPLNVVKTIDPETGAVTLTFYLAPGRDGVSPIIAVEEITGGHRVTVTDAQGTRSFAVMDGTNGDDGRGIASAVMNADYTLTLTYTDGTSYTTPSLRGEPGQDGYSPLASVSKSGKAATITITDKQGTTTATVSDGEDGAPGISPTITVTDITGGHRVTITDATGPHSFDVMDGEGAVQDVQVNGTSVVTDGVAEIPIIGHDEVNVAEHEGTGLVGIKNGYRYGFDTFLSNGKYYLRLMSPPTWGIRRGMPQNSNGYGAIDTFNAHAATFFGLAKAAGDTTQSQASDAVGQYTDAAKSAISTMLNGSVAVTGTTPTITALPGIRYICGECATLDITLPASGIVDVVFESGSTPTVLTITPPTGQTMKWANGFDPTSLDANTTYEINIADGLGVAASWT